MYKNSKKEIPFYQFENLRGFPNLRHGIFTRHFGFSKAPYNSMNVTPGLGDNDDDVANNRQRIRACLGDGELVFLKQVHGANVLTINSDASGFRNNSEYGPLTGDAVVTDLPGIHLVIQVADCQRPSQSRFQHPDHQHVTARLGTNLDPQRRRLSTTAGVCPG